MLIEKVCLDRIETLKNDGLIRVRQHPSAELYIANYTEKVQFDKLWTPELKQMRGLIFDYLGNIVARPLPKFFNIEEHQFVLPSNNYEVYEKLDGSLGILYGNSIASRGSFDSEQAIVGTEMFQSYYAKRYMFNPECTYLFEIIYPENRIVVDYGTTRSLVLLTVIHTATGRELGIPEDYPFQRAQAITGRDLDSLTSCTRTNYEGYVLRFDDGSRMKIKNDEYVRLHKLLTGVSEKYIWEVLKSEGSVDSMIEAVPDEFHDWVREKVAKLEADYAQVEQEAKQYFNGTRRAIAEYYKGFRAPGILFNMLDGKNYKEAIWKLIKPKNTEVFRANSTDS